jgi:hypothetical protein
VGCEVVKVGENQKNLVANLCFLCSIQSLMLHDELKNLV